LAYRIRRGPSWSALGDRLTALLVAVVVQGAIGYSQYFNDVPVTLVALHVVGVVVVWWLACDLVLATRRPVPSGVDGSAPMSGHPARGLRISR
jgi:cytochrome c oxidase assembly protein subunit 15